ncbi:MAG: photosystem reaction center subunit H [Methanobacteriota archaeon]|nr:MAG: photosystem reaction center subunit H [Euryarchaeota archaeon]
MIFTFNMEIRLSDLRDKQVTTVSGERLGYITNVILDSTSGELKTLVISSDGDIPDGYKVDSENMLNIPFETVRSVKDMVMVKI